MVEKKCVDDGDGNDDYDNNNKYMRTYYLLNATPFQNLQHRK